MATDGKPPSLFDHDLIARRRARARQSGAETFLIDRVVDDLIERLSAVRREFHAGADIATPTEALGVRLAGQVESILPVALEAGDALHLAQGSLDLAVSALALQFANDLPGVLAQIRRALKPDGLFLGALLGGDTLTELRQAFAEAEAEIEGGVSPRVAPFADLRDMGALLQRAGFALPVVDSDRLTVRYDSVFRLMWDLRRMGATNALIERRRMPLRRTTLTRMAEIYAARFSDPDGRLRATFEVIWLSGWAPDESQQKPLKPGSAQVRLSDVLRDKTKPDD